MYEQGKGKIKRKKRVLHRAAQASSIKPSGYEQ